MSTVNPKIVQLIVSNCFNPKQAGLFADWYDRGGGGGADSVPLCNFCLNSPIDLKFGMWIVLGKISRYGEKSSKKLPGSCSKR